MTALQSDQQKAPFEWINWLTLILPVPVASKPPWVEVLCTKWTTYEQSESISKRKGLQVPLHAQRASVLTTSSMNTFVNRLSSLKKSFTRLNCSWFYKQYLKLLPKITFFNYYMNWTVNCLYNCSCWMNEFKNFHYLSVFSVDSTWILLLKTSQMCSLESTTCFPSYQLYVLLQDSIDKTGKQTEEAMPNIKNKLNMPRTFKRHWGQAAQTNGIYTFKLQLSARVLTWLLT